MKDIIILYHAQCPDGFGSAWAAWKKFGDDAEYIPVRHNGAVPEGLVGKTIYFVDFVYPEEIMRELISSNNRVTAIDHHFSMEGATKMTQDYSYASDHSGSVLTWMYFHPNNPVPKILEYIEDRDLWKFNVENAKPICMFIDSFDFNFTEWDKLSATIEDDIQRVDCISRGKTILEYEQKLVKKITDDGMRLVIFEGYETYVVNASHQFADQICEILYKKKPPMAIVWREGGDGVNVSLRSDGSADVSKIAAKYGGGGHKASAGFSLPSVNSFPWKKIE